MVYLSTRFFLSAYLLIRASFITANCPGDNLGTGCWMCKESDLMKCLNPHIASLSVAQSISDVKERANAYCKAYAKMAQCWSFGRCCSEFSPSLAAATNVCNLAEYPESQISEDLLHRTTNDAETIREDIWHNNSGQDVPKFQAYVRAYAGSADSTGYTAKPSYAQQTSSKAKHDDHPFTSYSPKHEDTSSKKDDTHYTSKLTKTLKSTGDYISEAKYHVVHPKSEGSTPKQESTEGIQKSNTDYHPKSVAQKIHHKAQCSTKQYKCQSHVANQYHKARHQSVAKHGDSHLVKRHPTNSARKHFWKGSSYATCGLDFQGVPYPKKIPKSVLKVFNEY